MRLSGRCVSIDLANHLHGAQCLFVSTVLWVINLEWDYCLFVLHSTCTTCLTIFVQLQVAGFSTGCQTRLVWPTISSIVGWDEKKKDSYTFPKSICDKVYVMNSTRIWTRFIPMCLSLHYLHVHLLGLKEFKIV